MCSRLLLILLLLLAYFLLVSTAVRESPTVDEQSHLLRGVAFVQEGATQFLLGHPLLGGVLSALPLLTEPALRLPTDSAAWVDGDWAVAGRIFLWEQNQNPQRLIFLGRLPVMWLTLLLGALLAAWGQAVARPWGGVLAASLILLNPNVLAHGRLITGDVPLTFFFLLTLYGFARHMRRPAGWWWVVAGVGLGLAAATKYNAVLLLPILGSWAAVAAWHGRRWRPVRDVFAVGLLAWVIITAVYRFDLTPLPGGAFWDDFWWQLRYQQGTHGAYLFGRASTTGWWYYFPVLFLFKTPLPHLALFGWGGWQAVRHSWRATTTWVWLGAAVLYFLFSIGFALNIGYRYLIPVLPLLGLTAVAQLGRVRPRPALWGGLWLAVLIAPLWWWPHYIPYFNLLGGTADQRWQLFSDSNIDWGQDLPALANWQTAAGGGRPLKLSYFGVAYPSAYGVQFEPLPTWAPGPEQIRPDWQLYNPRRPAPGLYAISVTNLHGVVLGAKSEAFAYFRTAEPIARLGGTIFVYDVPAEGEPIPLALSGLVPADLAPELQAQWPGNDWQVRLFAAETSLVWAAGGSWAAVRDGQPMDAALDEFWPSAPQATADGQALYWLRPALPAWATAEQDMGGVLTFLGAQRLPSAADEVALVTAWRVEQTTTRPFKLFIHALGDSQEIIGQWDGLDVPPPFWHIGDLVVQVHRFPIPTTAAPPPLRLGLYDADTGTRAGEVTISN